MKCIFRGCLCDANKDGTLICTPCLKKINDNNYVVAMKAVLKECYNFGIEYPVWLKKRIERFIDVGEK